MKLPAMPYRAEEERPSFNTFLLCCAIIGSALFGLINFSFSAFHPDYIIVRQPIGDLELLRNGWIQSVDFIIFGLFMWAFAIGLRRELGGGTASAMLPLMHEITALALMIAGVFVHDPIHRIASIVIFISMIASFFLFAQRFKGDARWKGWSTFSLITGIVVMILVIMFGYSINNNSAYAGLLERMAMFARAIWLIIFTIRVAAGVRLTIK